MCQNAYKHGGRANGKETPEHISWRGMKRRCNYHSHYIKNGIQYAKEWEDYSVFLSDMGKRPENTTLDRIDTLKGYSKENCRWATHRVQSRNTRTVTIVDYKNEPRCLAELCEEFGLKLKTVKCRIKNGWDIDMALSIPVSVGRTPNRVKEMYVQNNT